MYCGKHSRKKAGKYCRRQSKNAVLILALILLLGVTIGGTVAYLVRVSDSVVNNFTPANVEIAIQEKFAGNEKNEVIIENKSNIPVFIRVALVGNWADADGKICINHDTALPKFTLGNNWVEGSDGFYYYTQSVVVGGKTTNLFKSSNESKSNTDGCSYRIEVIASAIQAEGMNATGAMDAWVKAQQPLS